MAAQEFERIGLPAFGRTSVYLVSNIHIDQVGLTAFCQMGTCSVLGIVRAGRPAFPQLTAQRFGLPVLGQMSVHPVLDIHIDQVGPPVLCQLAAPEFDQVGLPALGRMSVHPVLDIHIDWVGLPAFHWRAVQELDWVGLLALGLMSIHPALNIHISRVGLPAFCQMAAQEFDWVGLRKLG